MNLNRKINSGFLIITLLMLLSVSGANAARLEKPHVITPQPGPPAHIIYNPPFYKWTSLDIIDSFKERGLEIVNINNGLTQGSHAAEESSIFLIPSSGENIGGLVSSYRSQTALEEDRKYYSGMNKPNAPVAWRIFQKKNILILISGKVPEEKAIRYWKALNQM